MRTDAQLVAQAGADGAERQFAVVEAERAGRKWSRWLDEHLKFFYEVYRNSGRVH